MTLLVLGLMWGHLTIPKTNLKAAMAGAQETFPEVLHFCLSPLFSHWVKIKVKRIAKMEKSKTVEAFMIHRKETI